jgi:ribonuclease J
VTAATESRTVGGSSPDSSSRDDHHGIRVRIHRGANEIGGSCVELESQGSRLVLDVGKPLWAGWDEVVPLPAVAGLADWTDLSLSGVVISHPHLDHYGLIAQADSRVPIYIGKEATSLLKAAEFFSSAGIDLHPAGFLTDRVPLRIGAFTVTPFLMDHSAFDSYSLLVEAGGHRLFYTGDIRGHGRKSRLFEQLLRYPPTPVDVLLCEGTHVGQSDGSPEACRSERDVELSLARRMKQTEGVLSVISSAQNIDRLVTVYRACRRVGRILVTDLYTASLAHAIGRGTIPQPGFPDYKVYVPNHQRRLVKKSREFDRMELVRECRVFPEWLTEHAGEVTLLQPASTAPELLRSGVLANGAVVWSMWPGYLKEPSGTRLTRSHEAAGVPFAMDHASGHAPVVDLRRLASALEPHRLVPIHTEGAGRYSEFFENVEIHPDGEWWEPT